MLKTDRCPRRLGAAVSVLLLHRCWWAPRVSGSRWAVPAGPQQGCGAGAWYTVPGQWKGWHGHRACHPPSQGAYPGSEWLLSQPSAAWHRARILISCVNKSRQCSARVPAEDPEFPLILGVGIKSPVKSHWDTLQSLILLFIKTTVSAFLETRRNTDCSYVLVGCAGWRLCLSGTLGMRQYLNTRTVFLLWQNYGSNVMK